MNTFSMDENAQIQTEAYSEEGSSQQEEKMSKNQLKKQRKREKWLSIKQERRRHIKQNRKRRLAEMREKGEDLGPTRKSLKSNTMKNSSCKIRVVIDLSLDEYMTEKDVNSLSCQLQHSYSANRRAENPLQLYLCSLGGKTKQRLDEIGDYKGWDVYLETRDYEQVFPKESLVYLSSESSNVLTTLSEDKVYIIGGLVDHNQHKGLCHTIAEERGIAHAQLPIAEYLDMKTRRVLAVNHVFSILLRYTESNDWKAAFLAEMPQRKQAHLKGGEQAEGAACKTNETSSTGNDSSSCTFEENADKLNNCEVEASHSIKSALSANDHITITLDQESSVSNGDLPVQNNENHDNNSLIEKETESQVNSIREVKTQCPVQTNNKEGYDLTSIQFNDTTS